MNVIEQIENEQRGKLTAEGEPPSFAPGDTLRVNVKVVEGTRERVQAVLEFLQEIAADIERMRDRLGLLGLHHARTLMAQNQSFAPF